MKQLFFRDKNISLLRFYRNVLICILVIIFVAVSCVTYLYYLNLKNEIILQNEATINDMSKEYQSIEKNFWALYMPVFENSDIYYAVSDYFENSTDFERSPIGKKDLNHVMQLMANRDARVSWIAFYSPQRSNNYVFFTSEERLTIIPDDFPFWDDLRGKRSQMELYAVEMIPGYTSIHYTFAIGGGLPHEMGDGAIMAGYQASLFDAFIQDIPVAPYTRYTIAKGDKFIYDSSGAYPASVLAESPAKSQDSYKHTLYLGGTEGASVSFQLPRSIPSIQTNQNILLIILVGVILSLLAIFFYALFSTRIFKQIKQIKSGLEIIGNNNLEYRLPEAEYFKELSSISRSVNKMSTKLKYLIETEYLHQLKQKEAELAELQSKFDPHFLYNSLEIIRGRVYETGDIETADIIKKLSQIFRSFINKERFVTIQDELAFCNSYFSLIQSPGGDNIQVIYDVDSNILFCGIIRNLLQPLIENYFVHGFDAQRPDNQIMIRCAADGKEHVRIEVIDNGSGISDSRLQNLAKQMQDCTETPQQSYGLKNLSKRIQLFYGEGCGLTIENNPDKGVCVAIRLRKMSCEEHETLFQTINQTDDAPC